jgi:plasmid maintenance system antidote protein VapI
MEKNKNLEPESGVLTSSMNVNNKEFKEFQLFLTQKAKSLNEKEKLQVELFSLQMKIEDYLNSQDETQILTVGDFLRLYIDKLNLKQNRLAEYIGLRPANFSKILSGSRKVNFELSFTLSHIFSLDPKTWILIQVKNEYVELKREKAKYFQNFKLEELINK